ncbi:unnamed protein product, partial [Sphenostylis stenocarpa]
SDRQNFLKSLLNEPTPKLVLAKTLNFSSKNRKREWYKSYQICFNGNALVGKDINFTKGVVLHKLYDMSHRTDEKRLAGSELQSKSLTKWPFWLYN